MGFALDTQHQAFKFQPFQEKKKKEEERHKLDSLTSYDRKFPYFFFLSCGIVVYVSFLLPL